MSRHEADPLEQVFARSLADFDDDLATGRVPAPADGSTVHPSLVPDLIRTRTFLRDLEQVWPRASAPRPPARGDEPPDPLLLNQPGPAATSTPRQLGRFRILRRLGGGGGGIVFLAHDPVLDRPVALKIPRPEALVTPELRRRFLGEARAAAGLDHPNLVPVFETGEVGPICYIASAYCEGTTLDAEMRRRTRLESPTAAARLIATLADAVHHVHGRGILHRDLKPSNILLVPAPRDAATPEASRSLGLDYVPKLTDFGLARLLEVDASRTRSGVAIGTPKYMAPEQAKGRHRDLGPATDVYALGVVLYELLVGRGPFDGDSEFEILQQVIRREPVPPRLLRSDVPRDLEAVCLRCLEKDPGRRYATALDLADDLRRFQGGRPTQARPLGRVATAAKWTRQHPRHAAVASVLALSVVVGWAASIRHGEQLRRKNVALAAAVDREARLVREATRQRDLARQNEWLMGRHIDAGQVRLAQEYWEAGSVVRTQEVLRELTLGPSGGEPRGLAWQYLWRLSNREVRLLHGHAAGVVHVAVSADGRTLVSLDRDGAVFVWDLGTLRPRATFRDPIRPIQKIAFSPDGRAVACVGRGAGVPDDLSLWDAADGSRRLAWRGAYTGTIHSVAFSPSGQRVAAAGQGPGPVAELRIWDASSGRELPRPVLEAGNVGYVAFSPDGRKLAAATDRGPVLVWDLDRDAAALVLEGHRDAAAALSFSPDGATLASGGIDATVRLWDAATGRARFVIGGASAAVESLAFSPDGTLLTAGGFGSDGVAWETATGRERLRLPGHIGLVRGGAFAPDGRTLATWSDGRTGAPVSVGNPVKLWDVATGRERADSRRHADDALSVTFTPDGKTLILGCIDPRIRLWQLSPPADPPGPAGHPLEAWAVGFTPDGRLLASGSDDQTARLWDAADGRERAVLRGHSGTVSALAISPDGAILATAGLDNDVRLWDLPEGGPRAVLAGHSDRVRSVAFSPDGSVLASTGSDGMVRLWEPRRARALGAFPAHHEVVRAVAFSPDSRTLATAGNDRTVRLWDPATGRCRDAFRDPAEVWSLAFSPDGNTIAWANGQGVVTLMDLPTRRSRATLKAHVGGVRALAFSSDGKSLATGGDDHLVKLWQPDAGQLMLVLAGHRHWIHGLAFSPDGQCLASASHDGAIRLWRGDRGDTRGVGPRP